MEWLPLNHLLKWGFSIKSTIHLVNHGKSRQPFSYLGTNMAHHWTRKNLTLVPVKTAIYSALITIHPAIGDPAWKKRAKIGDKYELYMDYIWIIYGLHMDYICIIYGLYMDLDKWTYFTHLTSWAIKGDDFPSEKKFMIPRLRENDVRSWWNLPRIIVSSSFTIW